MKGLLMWIVGVAIGVTVMTPIAIVSVESRPVGEWMGIAFFLLCQLMPFNLAMLATCLVIYRHIQARIAQEKGA